MLRFGVEYELENIRGDELKGWTLTHDGTLRNGYEYVFKGPVRISATLNRIKTLIDHFKDHDYTVSHRCSTHIHVSDGDFDREQYIKWYNLLVASEDFFFKTCEDRRGNNFCVPMLRNPNNHAIFSGLMGRGFYRDSKYCSVNAYAMESLGTLELRHFAPMMNPKEMGEVIRRINLTHQLVTDDSLVMPEDMVAGYAWQDAAWQQYRQSTQMDEVSSVSDRSNNSVYVDPDDFFTSRSIVDRHRALIDRLSNGHSITASNDEIVETIYHLHTDNTYMTDVEDQTYREL